MVFQPQAQPTRINIRQLRCNLLRTFPMQKQHHCRYAHLWCDIA